MAATIAYDISNWEHICILQSRFGGKAGDRFPLITFEILRIIV